MQQARATTHHTITALALSFFAVCAFAKDHGGNLLAPVYPAAQHAPEFDNNWFEVWLSQDPPDAVLTWYEEQLARAATQPPGKGHFILVLPYKDAVRTLRAAKRNPTLALGDSGVEIHAHHNADIDFEPCLSDHFSDLRHLLSQGRGDADEFDELCDEFAWIERAFFRMHDPDDLRQPMDKYLLARTQSETPGAAQTSGHSAAELGERIQELTSTGRYAEANQLMVKMLELQRASATPATDSWDRWVQHLQTVAENAYRTKIVINKKPLEWRKPD